MRLKLVSCRTQCIWIVGLITTILALLVSDTTVWAIEKGDRVEFHLNGQNIAGTVTEVLTGLGPARLMVDVGTPERPDKRMIKAEWVKTLNGEPVTPPPAKEIKAVGGIAKGDWIEFEDRGQRVTGVVTQVRPGGRSLMVNIGTPEKAELRQVQVTAAKALPGKPGESAPAMDAAAPGIEKDTWVEFELRGKRTTGIVTRLVPGGKWLMVNIGTPEREDVRMIEINTATALPGKPEEPAVPTDFNSQLPDDAEPLTLSLPPAVTFPEGKELALRPMAPPAEAPADPADERLQSFKASLIDVPKMGSRETIDRPLIIDPAAPVLAYSVRYGQSQGDQTAIHVCLGGTPARRLRITVEGHRVWLASSDPKSGNALGIIKTPGWDTDASLCVIAGLGSGSPRVVAHWNLPTEDGARGIHAHYRRLATENVVVVTYNNVVRAFDAAAGRELWRAKAPPFFEPAVSPGGKFVALRFGDHYGIVETASGRQLGAIPANGARTDASIGFSPDGPMFAVASENHLAVYSLAGGRLLREHHANVSLGGYGKPLIWPYKGFLLTPTGLLIDLSKNLIVWKYNMDGDAIEYLDRRHSGLFPFVNREAISFVRLPHREAGLAGNRDLSDLVAIKPGSAVQVVLEVMDDVKVERPQVQANLEQAVTAAGYRVDPSADVQLVAWFVRGKERTRTFVGFGGAGGNVTVTYAPFGAGLKLQKDGETLWELQTAADLPNVLGGSVEAAARSTEHPGPNHFRGQKLPTQVLKKEYQAGFGSNRVALEGIQ